MRILTLSNLYPPFFIGGYELNCHNTVEGLRGRGHEMHVLTSDYGLDKSPIPENEKTVYRLLKIHGMYGNPWLGIHQLQSLEKYNNRTLRSVLEKVSPDLVYIWNMGGLSKSMLLTLQELGIPTAFYVSDHWIARCEKADVWLRWWNCNNPSFKQRILRNLRTVSGFRGRCQKVTPTNPVKHLVFRNVQFCSEFLRTFTAEAGFPVSQGIITYCPVNIERFNAPVKPVDKPLQRLLVVGRITQDKGTMTAIKAMELVRDKFAGELTVCGKGEADYEKEVRDYAASRKLPIKFTSVSSPDAMPALYREHDALLFTSEWEEPFAITPLEAMASGLPVIGTMTGGSKELFREGQNALTYNAGSSEQLARQILRLDKNPELRFQIANTGRTEVHARYNEKAYLDQADHFLKESFKSWAPVPLQPYNR
ncbi:MAG: hypothetical protein JWN25_2885 [Verrucomicrobiales bacterium]|nr:hypothetical protein [Verrucomicrobiales bacterium]